MYKCCSIFNVNPGDNCVFSDPPELENMGPLATSHQTINIYNSWPNRSHPGVTIDQGPWCSLMGVGFCFVPQGHTSIFQTSHSEPPMKLNSSRPGPGRGPQGRWIPVRGPGPTACSTLPPSPRPTSVVLPSIDKWRWGLFSGAWTSASSWSVWSAPRRHTTSRREEKRTNTPEVRWI